MDVAYKRRFSIGVPKGRRSGSWFDAEYWPEGHPGGTDRTLRNGGQAEKWSDIEMKTFQPVVQFGMWK